MNVCIKGRFLSLSGSFAVLLCIWRAAFYIFWSALHNSGSIIE
ncbi:Uncharacterised protein [Vibrio cholerae]|nr:Uncharacterised protein [Vibrio cholerae]